jgi:hypothetical protein
MAAPAEKKVKAGSAAAIAAGLIDWALARWVFPHGVDVTGQALILAAVPGVLSYAAGYLAPHTPRPAVAPSLAEKTLTPPPGAGM